MRGGTGDVNSGIVPCSAESHERGSNRLRGAPSRQLCREERFCRPIAVQKAMFRLQRRPNAFRARMCPVGSVCALRSAIGRFARRREVLEQASPNAREVAAPSSIPLIGFRRSPASGADNRNRHAVRSSSCNHAARHPCSTLGDAGLPCWMPSDMKLAVRRCDNGDSL